MLLDQLSGLGSDRVPKVLPNGAPVAVFKTASLPTEGLVATTASLGANGGKRSTSFSIEASLSELRRGNIEGF